MIPTIRYFEFACTYGERTRGGFYWRLPETDWVGPFADQAEALDDADSLAAE